jgi:hypothetical protein
MEGSTNRGLAIAGISIGIGILLAGLSVSRALYKTRATERYVTVRGLAEREVDADLAIWPITFQDAGNDLADLQKSIDSKRTVIADFLIGAGFARSDISHAAPRIGDIQAMRYRGVPEAKYRYNAQTTVTLRSTNVARVKETMGRSGDLVRHGIALGSENWGEGRTLFLFTGLNRVKPEMIEEATVNAREAAEKFAKDSRCRVGAIRNASQGLFTVEDRDPNSPDRKKVRVVTSVQYYLVDE